MSVSPSVSPSLVAALRLFRSEGIGPVTYRRMVERFGSADAALQAMQNFKKKTQAPDINSVNSEILKLQKMGGKWLCLDDDAYPRLLHPLEEAPPVLSMIGDSALLQRKMIAIVGARNASTNGRRMAALLARDLGRAGYVVVSGLARGIDTAAHEAALETGTIAVLANGVDIVYPPENKKLYDAIAAHGLLLGENPVGTGPAAPLFPRRNRIISGLCRGVIVVEAAMKSGSLITARCALDQGREVFAIPGSPLDPRAGGPNYLVKSGQAHLVESAEDVLEILDGLRSLDEESPLVRHALAQVEAMESGIFTEPEQENPPDDFQDDLFSASGPVSADRHISGDPVHLSLTDDQALDLVLSHLGPNPCPIDHLAHATRLDTPRLLGLLVTLELTGRIQRTTGDMIALL